MVILENVRTFLLLVYCVLKNRNPKYLSVYSKRHPGRLPFQASIVSRDDSFIFQALCRVCHVILDSRKVVANHHRCRCYYKWLLLLLFELYG